MALQRVVLQSRALQTDKQCDFTDKKALYLLMFSDFRDTLLRALCRKCYHLFKKKIVNCKVCSGQTCRN